MLLYTVEMYEDTFSGFLRTNRLLGNQGIGSRAQGTGHRAHQQTAAFEALGELDVEEEGGLDASHEAQEGEEEEERKQQVPYHIVQQPAACNTPFFRYLCAEYNYADGLVVGGWVRTCPSRMFGTHMDHDKNLPKKIS